MTPNRETSRALAYRACTEIFLTQGRFPTVDLVVEATGVNNRRLASEVIKQWRQDLAERFREQQIEVPEAIRQLWQQALAEANQALAGERKQLEQAQQALAQEKAAWDKAVAERDREIDRLRQALEEKARDLERFSAELDRLKAALDDRQSRLAAALEENGHLKGRLQEAHAHLEAARERFEKVSDWANLRILEERERAGQEWSQKVSRLERELSFERLERQKAEARLRQAEERLDALLGQIEARLADKDQELALLRKERDQLTETVSRLKQELPTKRRKAPLRSRRQRKPIRAEDRSESPE
ncbi:hypothetical protein JCM13664_21670 [Methylothermus subterraneus]